MSVFSPSIYTILLPVLLLILMVACIKAKKLTVPAAFGAAVIGTLVFLAAGVKGVAMLLAFFILSVLATAYHKDLKVMSGRHSSEEGGRNVWQVLANGGVSAIMAGLMIINPLNHELYFLMMAASLASALADTLSSELGVVFGKRFYHVLTFKIEPKGLDGVISIEGSLIGVVGAAIIALIYGGFGKEAFFVTVAGVLGNVMDSILGAALERKRYIGNNMVNFLNTLFAAFAGMVFYLLDKMV